MSSIHVHCTRCGGTGRTELTGELAATYLVLVAATGETTAAELARGGDIAATAMSNRLAALQAKGLATSRWCGRRRLYTAVRPEKVVVK